ncbi:MAG: acyl carrier protein [bacterium]|nr:acyl carrier protein [bacterium]
MATVFERVKKVTIGQLGVEKDKVVPTASFRDDLEADSLDLVELIMAMEEEFSTKDKSRVIDIKDEDAEKLITVQDAVDWLRDHGVSDDE